MPSATSGSGVARLTCDNCRHTTTVQLPLWRRIAPRMACGHCRKTSTWRAA